MSKYKLQYCIGLIIMSSILFSACSENEIVPEEVLDTDKFTIEIVSEVDGVQTRAHVGGTTSGAGLYAMNEDCTVTATPDEGYLLESFEVDDLERFPLYKDGSSYTFPVPDNMRFVAKFKKKLTTCTISIVVYNSGTLEITSSHPLNSDITATFSLEGTYLYHRSGAAMTGNYTVDNSYKTLVMKKGESKWSHKYREQIVTEWAVEGISSLTYSMQINIKSDNLYEYSLVNTSGTKVW